MKERRERRVKRTYVKKNKRLGPVKRIPLEVLGSSLQYLLIDTPNHLSNAIYQLRSGKERKTAYSNTATIKGITKDLSFNLQALRAKYAWIGTVIIIAKRGYQLNPSHQLNVMSRPWQLTVNREELDEFLIVPNEEVEEVGDTASRQPCQMMGKGDLQAGRS